MSKEESVKDLMQKRNQLIIEVARMRKEYPPRLILIEKKISSIQHKEMVGDMINEKNSTTLLHNSLMDDFDNYKKQNPGQNVNFRNFEKDTKRMQEVCERIKLRGSEEEASTGVDMNSALRKMDNVAASLQELMKVQQMVKNEPQVFKVVREEFLSRKRSSENMRKPKELCIRDAIRDGQYRIKSTSDSFCEREGGAEMSQ